VALNGLYVPVNAPWYPAFRAELLSFPAGRNDDQVVALGLCGQLLDVMIHGHVKKAERLAFDPIGTRFVDTKPGKRGSYKRAS
jgi:phage terminase large subunit-like protein